MNANRALIFTAAFVGLASAASAFSPQAAVASETSLRVLHLADNGLVASMDDRDYGPATIDVSSYPPEIQAAYKVFSTSCNRCHSLARPINTDMSAPNWKAYVKKMMSKPGSGISPSQGKTIYEFLKYYQTQKDAKRKAKG